MKQFKFMLKGIFVWISIAFFISGQSGFGEETTSTTNQSNLRAIKDVSERLNFGRILKENDGAWVLANIIPSQENGIGKIKDGGFMVGSDKMYSLPGKKAHIESMVEGVCNVKTILKGTIKNKTLKYQWKLDLHHSGPSDLSEDMSEANARFSPLFTDGGFIICRINEESEGADRIRPVVLLPPGWEKFVESAWKVFQESSELFRKEAAPKKQKELSGLLKSENSLLAVLACRALGEAGLLDANSLFQPLSKSREFEQAAFMLLLWKYIPASTRPAFVKTIGQIIEEAKSSEDIKGIALGTMLTYEPFDGLQYELQILKALEKKQVILGIQSETDRYVENLVKGELEGLSQQVKENDERKKNRDSSNSK